MKSSLFVSTLTMVAVLAITSPALARVQIQLNTSAEVGVAAPGVGTTSVNAKASASLDARISKAKDRADKELDRRTQMLTELSTKVAGMNHVSEAEKTAISSTVSAQISALADLKTKIAADTDLTTLKTDIQSIAQSYRIFLLVIPRARIDVAADKVNTATADLGVFADKLQARISAASGDTSAMTAQLGDMNTKVADAKTQSDAAVSAVANLQPDNGDKSVQSANADALKSARAKIKVALDDLKTARKDAGDIVKALGGSKAEVKAGADASASSSATAQ